MEEDGANVEPTTQEGAFGGMTGEPGAWTSHELTKEY